MIKNIMTNHDEIAQNQVDSNERIHSIKKKRSSATEAWANQAEMTSNANVSIPSDDAISEAKDWVDNGSKL